MNGSVGPLDRASTAELGETRTKNKYVRRADGAGEERRNDPSMRQAVSKIYQAFQREKNYAAALSELLTQICVVTGLPYASALHSQRLSEGVFFDENNHHSASDLCLSQVINPHADSLGMSPDQKANIETAIEYEDTRIWLASQLTPRVLSEHSSSHLTPRQNGTFIKPFVGLLLSPIWVGDMQRVALLLLPEDGSLAQSTPTLQYIRPLLGAFSAPIRLKMAGSFTNLTKCGQCTLEPAGDVALMRVEQLFEHLYEAVLVLNARGTVISLNVSACELFGEGNGAKELTGIAVEELLPGYAMELHHAKKLQEDAKQESLALELHLLARRPDNALLPLSCRVIQAPYGKSVVIVQDVHRLQKATEATLRESERFKTLADMAPVGILEVDAQWQVTYANERWCNLMHMRREDLSEERWIHLFSKDKVEEVLEGLNAAMSQRQDFSLETEITTSIGELGWGEFCARPLMDEAGHLEGFIATLTDTTFRHHAETKLRELAENDALTHLVSRHGFMLALEEALQSNLPGAVALLCIDLDGFKHVNDTLGHDFGDEVLKEVANRLQSAVRSEDVVARVGGDEFMLIMHAVDQARVCSIVAEKVLAALCVPMNLKGHEIFTSASVGIALSTQTKPLDSKTLLKQADMALYKAKARGKNTYEYYTSDLQKNASERLYLGNSLHNALAREEFVSYFQLQLNILSGQPCGVECLARWKHPTLGLLAPDRFISLVEETGLIDRLFVWQAKDAWLRFSTWKKRGLLPECATLSFNLSGRHFQSAGFFEILDEAIEGYGLDPDQIVFEITESILLHSTEQVTVMLARLKEMGFRIAMDDFGTGFSSLTYLKRFPIDQVKIDKSFVQDILIDENDCEITKAVINLSKSMKKTCVAEGVESEEILALLREWGCDEAQGYFINRPMPTDEFETLMQGYIQLKKSSTQ